MQPADLRAMRRQTGYTQEDFAKHMGISRKVLNEIEGGKAPLERRTMMAAKQAFNELMPVFSLHQATPVPGDVALADATILWDPYHDEPDAPPVKVIGRGKDDRRYMSSNGAATAEWIAADDIWRLRRLLGLFVQLTVEEGVAPADVHRAFSVIPEYRRTLDRSMFAKGIADVDD